MKVGLFLLICAALQMCSNVMTEDCMSLLQIAAATRTLCKQRRNKDLWQQVIDCHRPITDEVKYFVYYEFLNCNCLIKQIISKISLCVTVVKHNARIQNM